MGVQRAFPIAQEVIAVDVVAKLHDEESHTRAIGVAVELIVETATLVEGLIEGRERSSAGAGPG